MRHRTSRGKSASVMGDNGEQPIEPGESSALLLGVRIGREAVDRSGSRTAGRNRHTGLHRLEPGGEHRPPVPIENRRLVRCIGHNGIGSDQCGVPGPPHRPARGEAPLIPGSEFWRHPRPRGSNRSSSTCAPGKPNRSSPLAPHPCPDVVSATSAHDTLSINGCGARPAGHSSWVASRYQSETSKPNCEG